VYFSTDFDEVDSMNTNARVKNDYAGTTYDDPCDFEFLVDYYWRVVVADSSGYQNHGDMNGFYEGVWDQVDSSDGGGSINMDGEQGINIDRDFLLEMPDTEVSVSIWFKGASNPTNHNWLFSIGGEIDNFPVQWNLGASVPSDSGGVLFVAGEEPYQWDEDDVILTEDDSNDILEWTPDEGASPSGWEDDWHHFVFMKNETEGTMSIYFDGLLVDQRSGVHTGTLGTLKGKVDDLKVGAFRGNDSDYVGQMDDLKIFSIALSDNEVALIYRRGDLASAWGPDPSNGGGNISRDANLGWHAGNYATHHEVYFGTSFADVNDAITLSSEYKGPKAIGNELYNPPGDMELGKTYYWRIDEVNDVNNPDHVWKGKVWKFTIAEYIIIDDFEHYIKAPDNLWETWDNPHWSGSFIETGVAPHNPVNRGNQSMKYSYDITEFGWAYYAEVERNFSSPQDWDSTGVKMVTLSFYGHPDNDANSSEQMSVGLEDGDSNSFIDYDGDMNDIKIPEWQEWNIALSEFTGVDMTDVRVMYIRFGDPYAVSAGGSGIVYMDDVRIYTPKCIPSEGPTADLSGNCVVDLSDVRILGEHWLRSDAYVSVSPPGSNPIAHWELDEASGVTALDSAGAFNGTLEGNYRRVAGYIGSGAVDFSGGRVLVDDHADLRSMSEVTAMAWIYYDQSQNSARIVVKGADNKESYELEVDGESDLDFVVREANSDPCADSFERYDVNTDTLAMNEWFHIAGTYEGTTMTLYVNGQVEDFNDSVGSFTISQDPCGLAIGNLCDANNNDDPNPFIGKIDDVRVYDAALSEAEIAHIATGGTGYVPLRSIANLHDGESPEVVNFRDYAVIMSAWLEEKLWPLP
jgi:hypothetical protein